MKIENLLAELEHGLHGDHKSHDMKNWPMARRLFERQIGPQIIERKQRLVDLFQLDDAGRMFIEATAEPLSVLDTLDWRDPIFRSYEELGREMRFLPDNGDDKRTQRLMAIGHDICNDGAREHLRGNLIDGKLMWLDSSSRPARPGRMLARSSMLPGWEAKLDTVVSGLVRCAKQRILVSVNPFDMYLMSSDNRQSFSTCHAPSKLYQGGPWQYMNDEISLVAAPLYADSDTFPFFKMGRVMVFVPDDKHIILNRGYGSMQANYEIGRVITSHLTGLIGGNWVAKNDLYLPGYKQNRTAAYADTPIVRASIRDLIKGEEAVADNLPQLNFHEPICVECGEEYSRDDTYEYLRECEDCKPNGREACEACGDRIDEDSVYHNDDGQSFCEDCYSERYTSCDKCGLHTHRDDIQCIGHDYWCEDCVRSYAFECENCNHTYDAERVDSVNVYITNYFSRSNTVRHDEQTWCPTCVKREASHCDSCDEAVYHSHAENVAPVHTDKGDMAMCYVCREEDAVQHNGEYYTPQALEPILGAIRFEEMIQTILETELTHA